MASETNPLLIPRFRIPFDQVRAEQVEPAVVELLREARVRLGIRENEKVILFFGHIAPYKGLEYLVAAFQRAALKHGE